ncbi:metalloregulator ArsR/SmtB family transcription factor [Metallumcola ferriviriculae]|uniref:Metalloregulator ArsR/SmtB family transcription factor n=1 Tax=Metallumcola ferriviriculae TaxID=3039180 RepID=A0AAU0ULK2_9FIRM|nr:metalloregulator ArsR/SmtB family transcription factor [Desulfitibacteraceae bacterium MK1]
MQKELFQFEADFFKALSHPARIGILENLRSADKNVNELSQILNLEGSAVSQQLAQLRAKNIVVGIKEGTKVTYSVKDPLIFQLLDDARRIFDNHLAETLSQWKEIKQEINKTRG